jgi:hypothetical protein
VRMSIYTVDRHVAIFWVWINYVHEVQKVNTKSGECVRFQVLMAVSMNFRVFWDVAPCSQVDRAFSPKMLAIWNIEQDIMQYHATLRV